MEGVPDVLAVLQRPGVPGVAVQDAQYSVSYPDLGPAVRVRAGMLARRGVSAGDRVAVMLPNCAASVEIYLACALLGAIWVGINPAAPQAEQDRQCALVTPTVIITAESLRDDDAAATFDAAPPDPSLPCAIGFSSGTTGTPKALVHSRAGISLAAAVLAAKSLRGGDRVGVILPMSIHNVMVVGPMAALFAGATTVAVDRMNAAGVAAACRDRHLTMVNALVPTTIYDLVHDDTIEPQALASLRLAGTGAAGLSESLRSAFEAKFGVRHRRTGRRRPALIGSYGMTEAPGVVSIEDPEVPHLPGACGPPLPQLEISACDEQGRQLPPRQEGELQVCAAGRGPWADLYRPAIGTWGDHGLQRRPPSEKCFRTGDYGWVGVDGTVHVSGRRADVIVRGGVNVIAVELESVLGDIEEVREVAVVGEHDDRLGQRIVAFVEPASGAAVDVARLRQQARELLSHSKVPDEIVVVDALPRNAMGKVARGQLMSPTTSA